MTAPLVSRATVSTDPVPNLDPEARGASIAVRRIATLEDLERLGPTWDDLLLRCTGPHVLMDHRWVCAWWRHFGHGKEQHTLLFYDGGSLVGIVPLVISRGREVFPTRESYAQIAEDFTLFPAQRPWRLVPIRRLSFPLSIAAANLRGGLLFPQPTPALYAALAGYCARLAGSWDLCVLEGFPEASGEAARLLPAMIAAGLRPGARAFVRTLLRIQLPESLEAYLRSRSRNSRKGLAKEIEQGARRVADRGAVTVRVFRGTDLTAGLDLLFSVEHRSWKAKDDRARRLHLRLDDRLRAFHGEVVHAFAATDRAQVLVMFVGDDPAAAMLTLEHTHTAVGVLSHRVEEYAGLLSNALLWRTLLQRSIDAGLRRIDINGYTRNYIKWATHADRYERLTLFNEGIYSRLLHTVDTAALRVTRTIAHRRAPPAGAATGGVR